MVYTLSCSNIFVQVYVDELSHLLSLAKHPRTTALLQSALTEAGKTVSKTTLMATRERGSSYSTKINEYGM